MIAPNLRQDFSRDRGARQRAQLRRDRGLHRVGKRGVIRDENGLRAGVVLSLREEIGCDPVGIAGPIREDQDLRRPRDHVDAHPAENQALGRRNICVSRAHDLGDRADGCRAIGERGDRLGAPHAIDFVDTGNFCCRQNKRDELSIGRRHHHRQTGDAGNLRWYGIHQHG